MHWSTCPPSKDPPRPLRAQIGPVTIIIDGLEQIADESASSLRWLPATLPARCSLLLSAALGSRAAKSVAQRGWEQTVTMQMLTKPMKRNLIEKYLERLHKTFEEDVMKELVDAEQTDVRNHTVAVAVAVAAAEAPRTHPARTPHAPRTHPARTPHAQLLSPDSPAGRRTRSSST